jgi:hypothetical protein
MNTTEQLKHYGLTNGLLAEAFGLSYRSFINSSARKRYEQAALKIIEIYKQNQKHEDGNI